jgi:hypothetical protein
MALQEVRVYLEMLNLTEIKTEEDVQKAYQVFVALLDDVRKGISSDEELFQNLNSASLIWKSVAAQCKDLRSDALEERIQRKMPEIYPGWMLWRQRRRKMDPKYLPSQRRH